MNKNPALKADFCSRKKNYKIRSLVGNGGQINLVVLENYEKIQSSYTIPKEENHAASFARLLAADLSLKRLVLTNYTKFNTVLETKHIHELQTVQFSEEDEINSRSDSTEGYEAQKDECGCNIQPIRIYNVKKQDIFIHYNYQEI
ncbi:hypothetical protein INT45_004569 [Circinella minor]|uniref:Uncharacterized protein n=1 Tax=Circinella minor TaxID=1195481 RepID=A0A8H7RUG3_9FUNG|nr:hypothetical protein INT45_004569 [Circinella minor]